MERLTKKIKGRDGKEAYTLKSEALENPSKFTRKVIDKLGEYEELEESGLVLPCKVGDRFFSIAYSDERIIEVECIEIQLTKKESIVWVANVERDRDYWKLLFEDFEKNCFKTRELLEQALKEFEKEGNECKG